MYREEGQAHLMCTFPATCVHWCLVFVVWKKPETTVDSPSNVFGGGLGLSKGTYPPAVCHFSLRHRKTFAWITGDKLRWLGLRGACLRCTLRKVIGQDARLMRCFCFTFQKAQAGTRREREMEGETALQNLVNYSPSADNLSIDCHRRLEDVLFALPAYLREMYWDSCCRLNAQQINNVCWGINHNNGEGQL